MSEFSTIYVIHFTDGGQFQITQATYAYILFRKANGAETVEVQQDDGDRLRWLVRMEHITRFGILR